MCMSLEVMTMSEITLSQKEKNVISHVCGIQKSQIQIQNIECGWLPGAEEK